MKTLVWKELRENIVWAALAMLALGGAEMFALYHSSYRDVFFYEGVSLCKESFLSVTMFGFAVAGLGLGFLQVLPELKRDRWAALLHRPISRGRFFWGKAIAGVILYLIAAAVPFFCAVWHVATPGHYPAPFVPKMMLAGLADLATGLCYYFAALLMALQSGRLVWRALPLFAAVHVTCFTVQEEFFRVAVEAAAAMTLALCLAGWGAVHARESLRRRPWLGRVALLVVAFYGACGASDLLVALGGMAGHKGDTKYSYWEILDNGAPARTDYVNGIVVSVTDANGKPFSELNYRPDKVRLHRLGMSQATSFVGDSHGWHQAPYPRPYRESRSYLWAGQPNSRKELQQWFEIAEPRYYAGILPLKKREFARLGMDGFAPSGGAVRAFPEEVHPMQIADDILVIAAPESLRYIHLASQKIDPIALPTPGPIYGMSNAWANAGNASISFEGIALGSGMAVYDADARFRTMLHYQHDIDRWGEISLGVLKSMDRFVLKYEPSEWLDARTRRSMPGYVDLMDAQGAVLLSYELPALPLEVYPPRWSNFIAQRLGSPAFFFGEMLYRRIGAAFGSSRLREALRQQLGPQFPSTLDAGRIIVLAALILSLATWFWARRAQLPPRPVWAWTVGVLVFGLPGFVIFWLAGERPRTTPCAVCRGARRIEDEHCGHCGAEWPAGPSDGTEIFDREPSSSLAASS